MMELRERIDSILKHMCFDLISGERCTGRCQTGELEGLCCGLIQYRNGMLQALKEPEVIDGITYNLKLVPAKLKLPKATCDIEKHFLWDIVEALNSQIKELEND